MAPSLTAVTATTTGSTSAITVTVPSGVVADSTVLVVVFCNGNNSVTGFGSSGLAHAPGSPLSSPTNQYSVNVLTKVATGSESGSYSLTMGANDFWAAGAARVDGADTSTTWDTNSGTGSAVNTSASATSLTTSMTTQADNELLINVGGQFNGGTWTQPTGFTKDFTDTAAPGVVYFGDLLQAVAGATGTLTTTCSGGASQMVVWLGAVRPAVSVPTGGPAAPPLPPHMLYWLAAGNQQMWLGAGVGTQITADTGLTGLGLAATAGAVKVAVVTATAALGVAASGGAAKVAPETGQADVGLSANAIHVPISVDTGLAELGLAASATTVKVAKVTGVASVGLSATGTAKKISKDTGTAAAGLSSADTAAKVSKDTGTAALGLSANAVRVPIRAETGTATLGVAAQVATKKIVVASAVASVGVASSATARKVAKATQAAALGVCSIGTARKVSKDAGAAYAGVVARFAGIDLRAVTARSVLALRARQHQCTTYRSNIGTTTRPGTGTTARPFTGTTSKPC